MSLQSNSSLEDSHESTIISCECTGDLRKKSSYIKTQDGPSRPNGSTAPTKYFADVIAHSMLTHNSTPAIIVCTHKKSQKKEEYLNEAFVTQFNERIGDESHTRKARRLMKKMKILAGLHPTSSPDKIDIPAARLGFALLSGLNHHELKIEALNNLEYLLEHDPITENSSIRLVALAIKVMNQLDRELIQTEILEVQIKGAKIYGLLAELIQRHFAKKHINAITDDLRAQLLKTARALRALNRLEDPRLTFYVESALEGIKRILDDHNDLYELVDRLYNAAMFGVSLYFHDMSSTPAYFDNAVRGIDLKIKFSWYDASMTLLKLGRESVTDLVKLGALQKFVNDNAEKLNWKFLFLAVDLLTNIAINSPDPKIRKNAFTGDKSHKDLPGLLSFSECSLLGKGLDVMPVIHFNRPKLINHDATIRLYIAKALIRIGNESPDLLIRMRARMEFLNLYKAETSKKVLSYMRIEYAKFQGNEFNWVHEEPPFDILPVRNSDMETTSLTPRREIDRSILFQEIIQKQHNKEASRAMSSSEAEASIVAHQDPDFSKSIQDLVSLSEDSLQKQKNDDAISYISTAIKRCRTNQVQPKILSSLYLTRANAYFHKGDIPSTEHDLIKAVELDQENHTAIGLLSEIRKNT